MITSFLRSKNFYPYFFQSLFSKGSAYLRGFCVSVIVLSGLTACAVSHKEQTADNKKVISAVESYLSTVKLKDVPFVQMWSDGVQGAGVLTYYPGSLFMRYSQPHVMTLKANGKSAVFIDRVMGSETHMGLSRNPLGVLLEKPVRLSGSVIVTDVQQRWKGNNGSIQISMARKDNPSQGLVTLRFKQFGKQMTLYEIRILDETHKETIIDLESP